MFFPMLRDNHNDPKSTAGPQTNQSYDNNRYRATMHQLLLLQQESLRQEQNRVLAFHGSQYVQYGCPQFHENRSDRRFQHHFSQGVGAKLGSNMVSSPTRAEYQPPSLVCQSQQKKKNGGEENSATQPSSSRQLALENLWEDMFQRLVEYKRKHNHCLVPNRYKEDKQLGSWVSTQRRNYGRGKGISQDRIDRLEALGFVWKTTDPRSTPWMERYKQLSEFYDTYGHSVVPVMYEPNKPLANWVSAQRQEYRYLVENKPSRITAERIMLLNKLDFMWDALRHRAPTSLDGEDESADSNDKDTNECIIKDSTSTVVESVPACESGCRSEGDIVDESEDSVVDELAERRLRKRVLEAARKETDPMILEEVKQLGIGMPCSSTISCVNKKARMESRSDGKQSMLVDEDKPTVSYSKTCSPTRDGINTTCGAATAQNPTSPPQEIVYRPTGPMPASLSAMLKIGHIAGFPPRTYTECLQRGSFVRPSHLTSTTSVRLGLSSVESLVEGPAGLPSVNHGAKQGLVHHDAVVAMMLDTAKREFGRCSSNGSLIALPNNASLAATAVALGFRCNSDED